MWPVMFLFVTAPPPKRHKYNRCPPNSYAYWLLSGGSKDKYAKIYFDDEL